MQRLHEAPSQTETWADDAHAYITDDVKHATKTHLLHATWRNGSAFLQHKFHPYTFTCTLQFMYNWEWDQNSNVRRLWQSALVHFKKAMSPVFFKKRRLWRNPCKMFIWTSQATNTGKYMYMSPTLIQCSIKDATQIMQRRHLLYKSLHD